MDFLKFLEEDCAVEDAGGPIEEFGEIQVVEDTGGDDFVKEFAQDGGASAEEEEGRPFS